MFYNAYPVINYLIVDLLPRLGKRDFDFLLSTTRSYASFLFLFVRKTANVIFSGTHLAFHITIL